MGCDSEICKEGSDGGLFLPLGGQDEQRWPTGLRIVLYLLGLLWCFMGVAIVADVFMSAIERITSKKVRKFDKVARKYVTRLVWNATVANLSLMALGSSAPEILLNVIELFSLNFESGELGPSTIVGSAAFNLLVITAVCVAAIPAGQKRFIKELPVYAVTATFSVFAYLWLLIILADDLIEPWEGILTFLWFPVLTLIAFGADKGWFSTRNTVQEFRPARRISQGISKEELAEMEARIRQQHGKDLTIEQVKIIIEHEFQAPKTRAQYRVNAIREMTGGRRVAVAPTDSACLSSLIPTIAACHEHTHEGIDKVPIVEFTASRYTTLEDVGTIHLCVERRGSLGSFVQVGYATRDGSAKAGQDYVHAEGTLEFMPGEATKSIEVAIIDDKGYEQDEEFFVDLRDVVGGDPIKFGIARSAKVVIIDDDQPGQIRFVRELIVVEESDEDKIVDIGVERFGGGTGTIGCAYKTEDDAAVAGADFEHCEGRLEFESGQMLANIHIRIKAQGRYERSELFRLYLTDPSGGATFDPSTDGCEDSCIMSLVIEPDRARIERIDRIMSSLQLNWDKTRLGASNWKEQFREAINVNGGEEGDDAVQATIFDWVVHVVNLPWKLICACVPPTDILDGWLCFSCALIIIGLVTAIIGDMAGLLGCVMQLPDQITAITFVALGTSLPDTFASKAAALGDPYADASVGNVTGSNSVNVFLGLGLPWTIGSIYHASKGRAGLNVLAGNLTFSVGLFSACALSCIGLLLVRRLAVGAELGGPVGLKWATSLFLVILWLSYVGGSAYFVFDSC